MHSKILTLAFQLSDDALLAKMKLLSGRSHEVTAELIAHLAVLDERKRFRAEGAASLFSYCTEVLRFSEAAAFNRIKAARAVRKFPVILDLLANGSVNLTSVRLLAPHLTAANHEAVLAEAAGRTRREVEKIVARLDPQPDVPPAIRKLPAPASAAVAAVAAVSLPAAPSTSDSIARVTPPAPPTARPVVAPLSPERYRVQFTVGKETEDQLRRLQDLLRGEIPDGDPGQIFARALALLLQETEKGKVAATANPRPGRCTKAGTRHIPAEVARMVWARDAGRCAFVAASGRRCSQLINRSCTSDSRRFSRVLTPASSVVFKYGHGSGSARL